MSGTPREGEERVLDAAGETTAGVLLAIVASIRSISLWLPNLLR